jgi:hypothetical protein
MDESGKKVLISDINKDDVFSKKEINIEHFKDIKHINELLCAFSTKDNCTYLFKSLEEANKNNFFRNTAGLVTDNVSSNSSKVAIFNEYFPRDILKSLYSPAELGSKSPTFIVSEGLRFTFGVEIETNIGYLPEYVYFKNKLNLECIRDGSLRNELGVEEGGEYVTGVLNGDLGFLNLKKSLAMISSHCKIDKKCGIHVHVGNFNFSKQFIVLAYILALKIEDEIFITLPPSRRNNETCGRLKQQPYLDVIKKYNLEYGSELCYNDLFEDVGNGRKLTEKLNKKYPHPGGRYTDRYSRGISPANLYRYKWLNFVPSLFNMKGDQENPIHTLEFRCHPASLNYDKIQNWILFCFAFCNYVESNYKNIIEDDNITIEKILNYSYPKKGKELSDYFKDRIERFKNDGDTKELLEYKQKTVNKFSNIKEALKI